MDSFKKFGYVEKSAGAASDGQLAAINRLTLRELTAEEVFVFRVAACDDQVDRDFERFSETTLREMAPLFVGRTIIADHVWTARAQTARVFAAEVAHGADGVTRLILSAYMLRTVGSAEVIAAIEGGILKEVSVAVGIGRALCSVCGTDKRRAFCEHRPGFSYDGKLCSVELVDCKDAYELSFVAVPAQREAGVVKQYGGERGGRTSATPPPAALDPRQAAELALLELSAAEL